MIGNLKFVFARNFLLLLFDYLIVKFLHLPTLIADDVIMMMLGAKLKDRCSPLEVVTGNKPRRLKLRKHAVDCR